MRLAIIAAVVVVAVVLAVAVAAAVVGENFLAEPVEASKHSYHRGCSLVRL